MKDYLKFMPNKALVLSGGGAKGSFELGVVDYLMNDLKMDFQVICGVSTGALNASMLSQGRGYDGLKEKLEELKKIWFSIHSEKDIYKIGVRSLEFGVRSLGLPRIVSIYDYSPLKDKINKNIKPQNLVSSGKEFRIGVVSLNTSEYLSIDQGNPRVRDFILASTSIPVLFPPVEIKRQLFIDGGVREVTPLADAFRALRKLREKGPRGQGFEESSKTLEPPNPGILESLHDEIYIVLASPLKIKRVKGSEVNNILEILKRSVDILVSEIYADDIKHAEEVNEYIEKIETIRKDLYGRLERDEVDRILDGLKFRYKEKKQARVKIIKFEPEREYMDSLEFNPKKIKRAFEAGRRVAKETMGDGL
jgi:NTE family protein